MTETLPEKVIALDRNKINLPSGLEFREDPQAKLAVKKSGDIYHVVLSSLGLGMKKNLGRGGTNRDYALAKFNLNLEALESGKYEISYDARFRNTSLSSSMHEEQFDN